MPKTRHQPTPQQLDQRADALNDNRGTSGNNITNAHVHGNRGRQIQQQRVAQQQQHRPPQGRTGK
jgi:hypothetical protein